MGDLKIKPSSGGKLDLSNNGGTAKVEVNDGGGIDITLGGGATDDLNIDSNTLVVESDTNSVGIGTNDPAQQLHISGATPIIQMTDTDTGADSLITASNTTGSLKIQCDNNNETGSSTFEVDIDGSQKFKINADGSQDCNGTDHGRMRKITGSFINRNSSGSGGATIDIGLESDIRNIECMAYASAFAGGWMSGRYAIVSATASGTGTSINTIWSIGDADTTGVAPTFSKSATTTFRVLFNASNGNGGINVTAYYYIRIIMS